MRAALADGHPYRVAVLDMCMPEMDGLDAVRQVSTTGLRLLHSGGTLVIEHGELQAAEIAALLRADGWSAVATHRDLLGRDRSTTAVR